MDPRKVGTEATLAWLQSALQITNAPRHSQLLAVDKNDDVLTLAHRLQFLYPLQIHDYGAADALEGFGTELDFQGLHSLANNVGPVADVQQSVIASRFDPVNLAGLDEDNTIGRLDHEARLMILLASEFANECG